VTTARLACWLIACCGLACCAAPAGGGDWPQWGGSDARNMVSAEKDLPESFEPGRKSPSGGGIDLATTRNVRWAAKLGTQAYGNPTVAGGRVYVGTNDEELDDPRFQSTRGGLVKCFDERDGKLLWQLVIPRRTGVPKDMLLDHLGLGVCSSPTVEGERVYLVTSRAEVVCLDALGMANGNQGPFEAEALYGVPQGSAPVPPGPNDADILWRFDLLTEVPVWPQDAASCSILVCGDFLYVCASNGVDKSHDRVPLPEAPSLIVLDKRTGRMVGFDAEKIGRRLFHGEWSSPSLGVVGGQKLIFYGAGDGLCYAFAPLAAAAASPTPLTKVWSFDCNPPDYKVVNGQKVNYRDGDKRRNKGNKGDGQFIGPSEIIATPVFYRDRVYVATGQDPAHGRGKGILHCIDATRRGEIPTAAARWTYRDLDRTISTVSVADGLLYLADVAGRLHCLDADTGKPRWVYDTKAEIWGSTLVADGKVYLGSKKGLHVFAHSPQMKLLAEVRTGSPVYCTPVAANGVLFVASQRYLWAAEKK